MFGRGKQRGLESAMADYASDKFENPNADVLTNPRRLWLHLRDNDPRMTDSLWHLENYSRDRMKLMLEQMQPVLDLDDQESFEAALKPMMERWNGLDVPDEERQDLEVQTRMLGYVLLHRFGGDPQALFMG